MSPHEHSNLDEALGCEQCQAESARSRATYSTQNSRAKEISSLDLISTAVNSISHILHTLRYGLEDHEKDPQLWEIASIAVREASRGVR